MNRYCTCPVDQYERCQEVWRRRVAAILGEKPEQFDPAQYAKWGRMPPKPGSKPRGRPRAQ